MKKKKHRNVRLCFVRGRHVTIFFPIVFHFFFLISETFEDWHNHYNNLREDNVEYSDLPFVPSNNNNRSNIGLLKSNILKYELNNNIANIVSPLQHVDKLNNQNTKNDSTIANLTNTTSSLSPEIIKNACLISTCTNPNLNVYDFIVSETKSNCLRGVITANHNTSIEKLTAYENYVSSKSQIFQNYSGRLRVTNKRIFLGHLVLF